MKQPTATQIATYNRLTELNVSSFSQHKHIVDVLGEIITPEETIVAAAIGRNESHTPALFALTNTRLLYVEGDRLYHSNNEIAFSSIDGVSRLPTPILSSVTVSTQAGKYSVTNVNNANSRDFANALEDTLNNASQIMNKPQPVPQPEQPQPQQLPSDAPNETSLIEGMLPEKKIAFTNEELDFLSSHSVGVLSTSSSGGDVHANPVYYVIENNNIFILTREKTHKSVNMVARPQSSIVVIDDKTMQFVTCEALAKEVNDLVLKQDIYNEINAEVTSLKANIQQALYDVSQGEYTVFELIPTAIKTNLPAVSTPS